MTPAERKELDAVRLELKGDLVTSTREILDALREHALEVRNTLADQDRRLEALEVERQARSERARERASWANRAKWLAGLAASVAVVVAALHPWG